MALRRGSPVRSFSSDQLYGYADHFHDDDDMAVFNIVHERFCADLATYDVTHERCANEICPEAASELRAVAPESGRPGASAVDPRTRRWVEAGWFASPSFNSGRQAFAGRIGRGAKPPPQVGHTLRSGPSTQSAQ